MQEIKVNEITTGWSIAKKTKPLKAKPIVSLLVDKSVLNKFLIDTLEGKEPIGDGAVICVGEHNDIWQQMPSKLLKKYDVIDVDPEGWMICQPKLDNSIDSIQINNSLSEYMNGNIDITPGFFIIGQWGEKYRILNKEILIQKAKIGDYICRNREDNTDIWIVRKKIFENTYNIIS
jgi:hypothetical protein